MARPLSSAKNHADLVQLELLRAAGPGRRMALACSVSTTVIEASRSAIQRRHPGWDETTVLLEFAEVHYGRDLAERIRRYLARRA